MSKNITVLEGKKARNFSNVKKLRTNLVDGKTQNWIPEDEAEDYVDLDSISITENGTYTSQSEGVFGFNEIKVEIDKEVNLITKDISENGTYNASDDGADGFSSVSVNVAGGSISGERIIAKAIGNINGGQTVAIKNNITGIDRVYNYRTDLGYRLISNGTEIFFVKGDNLVKLDIEDIINNSATPEIINHITDPYLYGYIVMFLGNYSADDRALSYNVFTHELFHYNDDKYGHTLPISDFATSCYGSSTEIQYNSYRIPSGAFVRYPNIGILGPKRLHLNDRSAIHISSTISNATNECYLLNISSATYKNFKFSKEIYYESDSHIAGFNGNLVCQSYSKNNNGNYEVMYCDLSDPDIDNIEFTTLFETPERNVFGLSSDLSKLIYSCSSGLYIMNRDMSFTKYDSVKVTSQYCNSMFGNYLFISGTLFSIAGDNTMYSSNSKTEGDYLGICGGDVAAGQEGTAIVLFS